MVQKVKTKQDSKTDEAPTTEAQTARSKEAVEKASCCIVDIDALLDEMDDALPEPEEPTPVVLPSWHPDAEFDAMDSDRPEMPSMREVFDYAKSEGITDSEGLWSLYGQAEASFDERTEAWHDLRGLSMNRTPKRSGGCVC